MTAAQVHIDKTTTIPLELYWELIRAGERAKERGQHQLTKARGLWLVVPCSEPQAALEGSQSLPLGRLFIDENSGEFIHEIWM